MRGVSGTFVEVSKKYIEPAILKLETLAPVSEADWTAKIRELTAWCETSGPEIRALVAETKADLDLKIQERVLYLQEHAINVAFPQ